MAKEAEQFASYHSSMDVSRPYAISGFITLLSPGNTILTNYLDKKVNNSNMEDTVVSKLKFKTI